ncbi:MAG: hypothetical protein EA397_12020 [Deltaproteobacteria bacterium]|nr:MAG: hypothetical protein EA397_12020 [Deltaproteobacteria bacterium]
MGSSLSIAIAGATGAIGQELIQVLDRVPWRPAELLLAASPRTTVPSLEFGDERLSVEDAEHLDLAAADAVLLAVPPAVAKELGERALAEGILTIDLSGAFAEDSDVPTIVPWVNPEQIAAVGARQVVAVPSAVALMLASALGPLARAGLRGQIHATVLLPASDRGKGGIEELSQQVVSLFNAGTPPRRIFPQGLAFDVLPAVGAIQDDGWTSRERTIATQTQEMVGRAFQVHLSLLQVPVFSGIGADVHLRLDRRVLPDLVGKLLSDGGVRLIESAEARSMPRLRKVEGEPFVHAARVRAVGSTGQELQLWLGMDNLRATATCAVSLTAALLRDRLRAPSH